MKWYKLNEKTPKNKTFVVIYVGVLPEIIDSRYDRTVYNTYRLALYTDGKWLDIENFDVNLADTYYIDKWIEIPFENKEGNDCKLEMLDPIENRFNILDL